MWIDVFKEYLNESFCLVTVLIDLWFVWIIFTVKEKNVKRILKPEIKTKSNQRSRHTIYNATKSQRWKSVTFTIEKSPFIVLTIYSFTCCVITFAILFAINVNLFMVLTIQIANNLDLLAFSILGIQIYLAIMSIIYIGPCCMMLSWYNYGDHCSLGTICGVNIFAAHVWRSLHMFCSCVFVILSIEFEANINGLNIVPNLNVIFHIFCKWMTIQGFVWFAVYFTVSCLIVVIIDSKYYKQQQEEEKYKKTWYYYWFGNEDENDKVTWTLWPVWTATNILFNFSVVFIIGLKFYDVFRYYDIKQILYIILVLLVYTGREYFKQYNPVWKTSYYYFLGKYTYLDRTYRADIISYWLCVRRKQKELKNTNSNTTSSKAMWSLFCIFILIIAILLGVGKRFIFADYHYINEPNQNIDINNKECNKQIINYLNISSISTYPICSNKYGNSAELNVLDFTLFTMIAYRNTREEHERILNLWFGDNNWGKYEYFKLSRVGTTFLHISNDIYNYDIISIRGTKDQNDATQDLKMFTEIASVQFVSFIIPLTSLLPDTFLRWIISIIGIRATIRYDEEVYKYILENKRLSSLLSSTSGSSSSNHSIFLVGHSLGGGIAEIVGAQFANRGYKNLISFGLSSPGVLWSSKKFEFEIDYLDRTSISIIPRRDFVPTIDRHGGLQQIIRCKETSFAHCHFAWSSFCELMQSCSNKYVIQRNIELANCICTYKSGWGGIHDCCL